MQRTSRSVSRYRAPAVAALVLVCVPFQFACMSGPVKVESSAGPEAERSDALIEFKLAHLERGEGRTGVELKDTVFYIDPTPIVSDQDLVDVQTSFQAGSLILWIDMSSEAATRMAEVTGRNIGARMALFFNAELVSAPVIMSAGGHHGVPFVARVPIADPKRGAQLVQRRWPRQQNLD